MKRLIGLWILGIALLGAYFGYAARNSLPVMGDFRAFYCAGTVVRSGGDPYRFAPLAACEQSLLASAEPQARRFPVVPVPLPGYAIAPFVPLSLLSFPVACMIWIAALSAAAWATVVLMARLTQLPILALATALLPVDIGMSAMVGQVAPLVILALVAAAALLRADKDRSAALVTSLAMLEPHIGVGACITLLVFRKGTRSVLLVGAIVAILTTLITVGLHATIEYAVAVVPAHALANATEAGQLSVTSLLWLAGMIPTDAVRYGEAMFVAMVLLGVVVAARLAGTSGDSAYLVLTPPAFAMFGGVHVHISQLIVAALPLLVLAAHRAPSRSILTLAVIFLMLPWQLLLYPLLMLAGPLATTTFAISMRGSWRAFAAIVVPIGMIAGVVFLVWSGHAPHASFFVPREYPADSLVQVEWQDYVRAMYSSTDLLSLWLRVPNWIGAAIGLSVLTNAAFRRVRRFEAVEAKTRV